MDSGGGMSQGGIYDLAGTVGQPDAASSSGGVFDLAGGYWAGIADPLVFADGFEDGDTNDWSNTIPQWGLAEGQEGGESCTQ
jgi:hypothetical protein